MNVVQVRSPFKIVIDEPLQKFTQVKLYIRNKGDAVPTIPTRTLSKAIPDLENRECVFNISAYLQEFIEPISAVYSGEFEDENPKNWCLFTVERYSGGTIEELTLIDTIDYVGLNGFTDYMDGNQEAEELEYKLLTPLNSLDVNVDRYGYFNLLLDFNLNNFSAEYIVNGVPENDNLGVTFSSISLLRIPYFSQFTLFTDSGATTAFVFTTTQIEECKYTPVVCTYQNSLGGWQYLMFFKAQTNSIAVKGSEFNLLPSATDYNPLKGQSKVFNLNGNQSVKLNTGWVDENYDILIRDLLLSETVLLDDKPAKVKTKTMTFKTSLKDKVINYEIDFDYAFDLINNIV